MQAFLKAISGRFRPILALALLLLVGVLWIGLNSLDHSGTYTALHDAVLLDIPSERLEALLGAMEKLSQVSVQEKLILATLVAFSSCISLLSQPPSESVSDIIKAIRSTDDQEKQELKDTNAVLQERLNKIQETSSG